MKHAELGDSVCKCGPVFKGSALPNFAKTFFNYIYFRATMLAAE